MALYKIWLGLLIIGAIVNGDRLNSKLKIICENCTSTPRFFAITVEGLVECRPFPPLKGGLLFSHYILHPMDCALPYTPEVYTIRNITHTKRKKREIIYHSLKLCQRRKLTRILTCVCGFVIRYSRGHLQSSTP